MMNDQTYHNDYIPVYTNKSVTLLDITMSKDTHLDTQSPNATTFPSTILHVPSITNCVQLTKLSHSLAVSTCR